MPSLIIRLPKLGGSCFWRSIIHVDEVQIRSDFTCGKGIRNHPLYNTEAGDRAEPLDDFLVTGIISPRENTKTILLFGDQALCKTFVGIQQPELFAESLKIDIVHDCSREAAAIDAAFDKIASLWRTVQAAQQQTYTRHSTSWRPQDPVAFSQSVSLTKFPILPKVGIVNGQDKGTASPG